MPNPAGWLDHRVVPLTSPGDKQVYALKMNEFFLDKLLSTHGEMTLTFSSDAAACFQSQDFEQQMSLMTVGDKTRPVECFHEQEGVYHQVGTVTRKCMLTQNEADSSLKDTLSMITEQERIEKERKKTEDALPLTRKRKSRSFVTQEPPLKLPAPKPVRPVRVADLPKKSVSLPVESRTTRLAKDIPSAASIPTKENRDNTAPSASRKSSSSKGKKSSRSTSRSTLKEKIKIYETKKKQFQEEYPKYQKYYDYLQANGKRVQQLGQQWKEVTDRGKKEKLAAEIKKLHERKRSEVHNNAKQCAILVQRLNTLKEELEELGNTIKTDYKKLATEQKV